MATGRHVALSPRIQLRRPFQRAILPANAQTEGAHQVWDPAEAVLFLNGENSHREQS